MDSVTRCTPWCLGLALGLAVGPAAPGGEPVPTDARNEQAVKAVQSGQRTEANAAWWGVDAEDATASLQAAIDSGVRKLVVPYVGRPWIIRPITLPSKIEIVFEPGVVVLAKKDEFKGKGDSLFRATDATDITLRGYGATLRMRKKDYQSEPYAKAEWRMGLAIRGCKRITVEGLRIESTGGDGIYIGATGKNFWCEDVVIRDVVCHDNHRQGISVISAQNLLVENCVLSNTGGTAPQAGIDLEPNRARERLVNCVIRNCLMENNQGDAMLVYLKPLKGNSEPLSILFENCYAGPGNSSGMVVGAVGDDGPKGTIEFRNCVVESPRGEGASVYDKSAESARVRFVNCTWKKPWAISDEKDIDKHAAILVRLRRPEIVKKPGGVDFVDCDVYDDIDRPTVLVREDKSEFGVHDLTGRITLHGPHDARMKLGPNTKGMTLKTVKAP